MIKVKKESKWIQCLCSVSLWQITQCCYNNGCAAPLGNLPIGRQAKFPGISQRYNDNKLRSSGLVCHFGE